MAGQTVVSRNQKTTSTSGALSSHCKGAGSPAKKHPSASSVNNPFKFEKRRWLWWSNLSVASKLFLVGLCCCFCFWIWSADNNNRLDNKLQRGHLNLRPAFLTDDGAGDVDPDEGNDDGDDDGDSDSDEDDLDPPEENQEEEEQENEQPDEEGEDQDQEDNDDLDTNEEDGQQQKVRLYSPTRRARKRQRKIPRILIFTHYKNLLELVPSKLLLGENDHTDNAPPDLNTTYRNLTPDELEELTLAANVRHSIDVHNRSAAEGDESLEVLFWTDEDCIRSLERTRPKLVDYFKSEMEGMYKADICRGTALLEHGGFYLDVDVGVRHDLWRDLRPQTEFVTARVHQASNWVGKGFFQAILGASFQSPVLKRYLELFEQHYDGTNRIRKGPLGVLLLKLAWDQIREEDKENPRRPFENATELYQEILFQKNGPFDTGVNKGILLPAPTWGKRRACHFIVAGIANNSSNVDIVLQTNESEEDDPQKKKKAIGLQIPVLSRIPGSRMCLTDPEESDTANGEGGSKSNKTMAQMIDSMKWWEQT